MVVSGTGVVVAKIDVGHQSEGVGRLEQIVHDGDVQILEDVAVDRFPGKLDRGLVGDQKIQITRMRCLLYTSPSPRDA